MVGVKDTKMTVMGYNASKGLKKKMEDIWGMEISSIDVFCKL